jgi:peptide/nickel transport system permease protein
MAVVVSLAFLLVHLIPGDPARIIAGPSAPVATVQELHDRLGLSEPLPTQFRSYLRGISRGDLGTSFSTNQPVTEIIGQRLPNTARLAGLAFLAVLALSVPVGLAMGAIAHRPGRHPSDAAFGGVTAAVVSVPEFLIGVALVYGFGVKAGVLPVAGMAGVDSYVLPTAAIAAGPAAAMARIVRVETLRVLDDDYMRTARSKRLPPRLLYLRHAFPNLLTSTLTVGGLIFASLLGGSVVVENVFAWPGLGTEAVRAILIHDYPLIQGIVLVLGACVLVVNAVVDLLLALVDRRSIVREN